MAATDDVNRRVAKVFGTTLIVIGIAGFLIPAKKAKTSGAPAYNVFHLLFGVVGLVASRRRDTARAFNVGFGAIDLYQAVASRGAWFPQKWFRWRPADDVLHVVVGAALVGVGRRGSRWSSTRRRWTTSSSDRSPGAFPSLHKV